MTISRDSEGHPFVHSGNKRTNSYPSNDHRVMKVTLLQFDNPLMSLEGLNIDDHNIPLTIGIGTVVSEVQKTRQSCDYLLTTSSASLRIHITHVLKIDLVCL